MGLAGLWSCWWAGVLLSASLLTIWNLPAAAQLALQASLPNTQKPLAKPTISTSQGTVIEHEGMVTFHCYTADLDVSIHWVFNNVPLVLNERMQLSADGRRFTILTVQREDAGTYQCEVWGAVEVQSSDITFLQVNYGPDPVEIKVDSGVLSRGVVEVTKGSTVNFRAETQSYPAATYAWYLPNDSILPPTMRTFTIPAVSGKDEGIYRCLVSNGATKQSSLGVLKVLVLASPGSLAKPRVVFQGVGFVEDSSSVTLTCQTTYEGIGIHWLREGQPLLPSERLVLSADNRTLVIHSLRQDDAGPYQCKIWTQDQQALSDPFGLTTSCPQSSSLSGGVIAGIVTGVLIVVALVAGLGYYSGKAGWLSRILADDPGSKTSQPTSGRKNSTEPSADNPRPLNFRKTEFQGHSRVNQTFPSAPPEQCYVNKLPPAVPGGFALSPRNPRPKLPELPVGPFLPEGNRESNYQTLINPDAETYCQIGSKA